ncbi:MAG: glycosyltransferase family A protein, partial [Candidatus Omnitrophota bacterium]
MVSVIIPTYNRAHILSETIKSVFNQTYTDLEIVVVSDGFCADARRSVEALGDKRLKYHEIAHSGRPAVPRNFGIIQSHGQYLAFCDDDDIWMPKKLEFQVAKMREDKEIGLVYSKCLLQNGEKDTVVPLSGKEGFIFKELFLSFCFIGTSTVLTRRKVFESVGMFDEDMRLKAVEDYDLWLRIARSFKIGFVNEILAIHVENSSSLTNGKLIKIKRHPLVPYKFYKEKYIGLGLFLRKM